MRKVVQIAYGESAASENVSGTSYTERQAKLVALCDDGSIFVTPLAYGAGDCQWERLKPIPQDPEGSAV